MSLTEVYQLIQIPDVRVLFKRFSLEKQIIKTRQSRWNGILPGSTSRGESYWSVHLTVGLVSSLSHKAWLNFSKPIAHHLQPFLSEMHLQTTSAAFYVHYRSPIVYCHKLGSKCKSFKLNGDGYCLVRKIKKNCPKSYFRAASSGLFKILKSYFWVLVMMTSNFEYQRLLTKTQRFQQFSLKCDLSVKTVKQNWNDPCKWQTNRQVALSSKHIGIIWQQWLWQGGDQALSVELKKLTTKASLGAFIPSRQ